jgi:uncharacterized membrane protein YhaH (DUF805 family)
MDWKEYLFSFDGRAPRWEYWLFVAISLGYALLAFIVVHTILGSNPASFPPSTAIATVMGLPLYWPRLAIAMRRLHDRNKSGEWAWLFLGVPFLYSVIFQFVQLLQVNLGTFAYPVLLMQLANTIVSLWALIELGFLRCTVGDNRYGGDPLPPDLASPGGRRAPLSGGHRVRLTVPMPNGGVTQEFYYVAESNPERARTIVRDAKEAQDRDVKTLDTILDETIRTLNLKPGEFTPVPRLR